MLQNAKTIVPVLTRITKRSFSSIPEIPKSLREDNELLEETWKSSLSSLRDLQRHDRMQTRELQDMRNNFNKLQEQISETNTRLRSTMLNVSIISTGAFVGCIIAIVGHMF